MRSVWASLRSKALLPFEPWDIALRLHITLLLFAYAQCEGTTMQAQTGVGVREHHSSHLEILRLRAKLAAAEEAIDSLRMQLKHCRRTEQIWC